MDPKKGDLTKIRIFEAATKLFFLHGFYSVTYSQISKSVGLTNAAIYKHFADMDDLILHACLHWADEAEQWIQKSVSELDPAPEQLKAYLEVNLRYATKNREKDALLLGLYHYSVRSKEMLKVYESFKIASLRRIQSYVARGVREGAWSVTDSVSTANSLHSLIVGEVIKLVIQPKDESLSSRIDRVYEASLLVLNHKK
jgi:AcrR family transcriptional regulator